MGELEVRAFSSTHAGRSDPSTSSRAVHWSMGQGCWRKGAGRGPLSRAALRGARPPPVTATVAPNCVLTPRSTHLRSAAWFCAPRIRLSIRSSRGRRSPRNPLYTPPQRGFDPCICRRPGNRTLVNTRGRPMSWTAHIHTLDARRRRSHTSMATPRLPPLPLCRTNPLHGLFPTSPCVFSLSSCRGACPHASRILTTV